MVEKVPGQVVKQIFTDCHCHILPGLDDGPESIPEAVEMARSLSALGFSEIICTPHIVKGAYAFEPPDIIKAVRAFQNILHKEAIPLLLRPAAEYRFDEFLLDFLNNPLPLCEDLVLIDAHPLIMPHALLELAYTVMTKNKMRPLIAHPERYDFLDEEININQASVLLTSLLPWKVRHYVRNPNGRINGISPEKGCITRTLREMGCLFQGSIGSFAGIYGDHVSKRAFRLLRARYYDRLGTDAHRARDLAVWLSEGMNSVLRITGERGLNKLMRPLAIHAS